MKETTSSSSSYSSSASYSSSSSNSRLKDLFPLPSKYKILEVLGQGGFGVVLKCLDRETKEIVAIKTSKGCNSLSNEAAMMNVLMENNMDECNIIKFYGGFWLDRCLEFEILDISLGKYLYRRQAPMRLKDIRTVIQQLATAFDALKTIGVIHGDVKTANIMLVDQEKEPFKVKLIDFGLAIYRFQTKYIKLQQAPFFQAPEIMLGHPYSEAIDIWSLGCVMAIMMFGFPIFPGTSDYEQLQYMVDLLGPPPDHMLAAGRRPRLFFKRTAPKQWMLKTPREYWGSTATNRTATDNRRYAFRCLDEVKKMRLEKDNPTEADERRECIELLKAMLRWDDRERITPAGILNHPFITMSYLNSSSQLRSCDGTLMSAEASPSQTATPSTSQPTGPRIAKAPTTTKEATIRTDVNAKGTKWQTYKALLPSGLILVQPAPPENRIPLQEADMEYAATAATTVPAAAPDDASDHPDDTDDSKSKKKKRKNHFKRFCSWMKRTFCSNCKVGVVQE